MIQVVDLRKSFGSITAVDGISFEIARGETFGLLGPNGAGKTTTIHMLLGAIAPDAGQISIADGMDPESPKTREKIGLSPQALSIYEELSGEENLAFFGKLYGLGGKALRERIDWALELSGLTDRRKGKAATYSGGMKRRLNIACALIHKPEILVCDEPTVGVDPQSRNHIFETIERMKADGLTILYTTHYMEEAERLCDRIGIMDHGKLLAIDTLDALIEAHGGVSLVTAEFERPPSGEVLSSLPGELDGVSFRMETKTPFETVAQLSSVGEMLRSLHVRRPDLETVFLALTGRSLRD